MALEGGAGIYVHIPYCRARCGYCDFFTSAISAPPQLYLSTVLTEGRWRYEQLAIKGHVPEAFNSLYVGGGTPTVYSARRLAGFIRSLAATAGLADGAEITVETNPELLDPADIALLRQAGVTRLSVGLQTFSPRLLAAIGRRHAAAPAASLLAAAGRAGMETSIDLIFGLPGQSLQDWEKDLMRTVALSPDHVSVYELSLESATPLAKEIASGAKLLPAEEDILAMMATTGRILETAGLNRYEISNYSRPGRQCRHNINYWENGDYLGLGAGAVSSIAGRRWQNICNVEEYGRMMCAVEDPATESEKLDREASFRETVVLGLRMLRGVDEAILAHRFGIRLREYYSGVLDMLIGENLVVFSENKLRLSPRGLELANQVMVQLV